MSTKVFVDGQEGTTGLKIFEYLSERRDVEVLRIEETRRKDVEERRRLINAALTPQQKAQQLAGREPQGFDVCARMESADRAVLETLR